MFNKTSYVIPKESDDNSDEYTYNEVHPIQPNQIAVESYRKEDRKIRNQTRVVAILTDDRHQFSCEIHLLAGDP